MREALPNNRVRRTKVDTYGILGFLVISTASFDADWGEK